MGQAGLRLPAPHAGKSRSDSVPSALAATISYFAAWPVRRNRTFGGDPCGREHKDKSRRGRLAARDFRIVKQHAPQVAQSGPPHDAMFVVVSGFSRTVSVLAGL